MAMITIMTTTEDQKEIKHDLDEILLNKGKSYFFEVLKKAKSYTCWKIETVIGGVNYKTLEEKKKYIYILKSHLNSLPVIDRNQYIETLSEVLLLPEIDIIRILKDKNSPIPEIKNTEERYITAQKLILSTLFSGYMFGFCLNYIQESDISLTPQFQSIFDYICDKMLSGKTIQEIEQDCLLDLDKDTITDILFKSDEVKWDSQDKLEKFLKDNYRWLIPYWNIQKIKALKSLEG